MLHLKARRRPRLNPQRECGWMEIGILSSELIAVATLTIFSRASPNLGGLLFVRSLPRARQPPTTEWKPDLVSQSHRH